jgi:hypothetical protein
MSVIKACSDELVIESVIKTITHLEMFTLRFISQEYKLQTFFGNDMYIEVDAKDNIIAFALCDIRDNDWEEGEEGIPKRIEEMNRFIARLYGNQTKVTVITDDNWKREKTINVIKKHNKTSMIDAIKKIISETHTDYLHPRPDHKLNAKMGMLEIMKIIGGSK